MNSFLLYKDREWGTEAGYLDTSSIVQDLGLKTLFSMAGKEVIWEQQQVKKIEPEDRYLVETMRKVMTVPLQRKEEIVYRQQVIKDCMNHRDFVYTLYEEITGLVEQWDKLGRKNKDKGSGSNPTANLIRDIQLMSLFVNGLSVLKKLMQDYADEFKSEGFQNLYQRLTEEYSDETETQMHRILQDISFYIQNLDEKDQNKAMVGVPEIVLECGIGDGLKFSELKLESVATVMKKFRNPNGAITKLQDYVNQFTPGSIVVQKDAELKRLSGELEFQVIRYVVTSCNEFTNRFLTFFDQLHLQIAFYRGVLNLIEHMKRCGIDSCMPIVSESNELSFEELKELVMSMEQRVQTVGNSCIFRDKQLLVVTGANQGGKSTFLRSIGIAQVMMQCGMPVAAESFCSGIYPRFFTHFTRREDSAMNSGRLDDELRRMNQIVENVGDGTMILLNESFATTTEKEGSVIAYEIIKALVENGVKVLTVTHLLSFAQKVFEENEGRADSQVEFLSAERLEGGKRTFKMKQHAPELTSFGLDLYDEIVGKI